MLCIFYRCRGNDCVACESLMAGTASLGRNISVTDCIMN